MHYNGLNFVRNVYFKPTVPLLWSAVSSHSVPSCPALLLLKCHNHISKNKMETRDFTNCLKPSAPCRQLHTTITTTFGRSLYQVGDATYIPTTTSTLTQIQMKNINTLTFSFNWPIFCGQYRSGQVLLRCTQ